MACRTTHTYIILFVWHQSIIVKSSGQTPWQTNKHTQGSNQPTNHFNQPTNQPHGATRMWYMIWSPAMQTICLEQNSENFQSRAVTSSLTSSSQKKLYLIEFAMLVKILQPNFICLWILQPSNMATKCGHGRSWKTKVKPNLGCHNSIAIYIYIYGFFTFQFSFYLDTLKIDAVMAI